MNPSEYCDKIVRNIKVSNLHYIMKENPFSLQITIRKKFIDNQHPLEKLSMVNEVTSGKFELELEIDNLKKKLETKTNEAERLHSTNQDLMLEINDVSDELFNTKVELTKQNGRLKDSFDQCEKLETVADNLKNETKVLIKIAEGKFKELNDEVKAKKYEVDQLSDENKQLLEIISAKKTELTDTDHDVNHDDTKSSYYSHQSGSSNSKINSVPVKSEATSSLPSCTLDASSNTTNASTNTSLACNSVACQTNAHPDIPYQVTSTLPPIFSSELCYNSRPIFLSNSLPNLARMSQFQPTNDFTDEAEEALSEQHDRQIREFYEDERERVRAVRAGGPIPWPPEEHHHHQDNQITN